MPTFEERGKALLTNQTAHESNCVISTLFSMTNHIISDILFSEHVRKKISELHKKVFTKIRLKFT